jgi:hypothetical protein
MARAMISVVPAYIVPTSATASAFSIRISENNTALEWSLITERSG